jgi:putative transposase
MRMRDPKTGKVYYSKRLHRFDDDASPRELTFSCFRGYPFLAKDRVRKWFIEALEEVRPAWPLDYWAYVIMPEHVHLLVAPREPGVKVGRFEGAVKEKVARQAIGWMEEYAPEWIPRITVVEGNRTRRRFWQPGGGYDRNVDNLATLQSMIDYLHENPVRRRLVARAVDWEWSSARWYAGLHPVWIEMDRTLPTIVE